MSKLVTRIEKEFLLKTLYSEQIPLIYFRDRDEYTLFLKTITKDIMIFGTGRPVDDLRVGDEISLVFSFRGEEMLFGIKIVDIRDGEIVSEKPLDIRVALDRTDMRVSLPSGMDVSVSFLGDRFSFPLPRLRQYTLVEGGAPEFAAFGEKAGRLVADGGFGYRQVLFDNGEISMLEERLIAHTGKILFLANVADGIPDTDPSRQGRIVTRNAFLRYLLEDNGIEGQPAVNAMAAFMDGKMGSGVTSDAWIPIVLQEYAVGYLRVWASDASKPQVTDEIVRALHAYAGQIALHLKNRGTFNGMKISNDPFRTDIHNISSTGLLFSSPLPEISLKLMPGCPLRVTISSPSLGVSTKANIVRLYREKRIVYVGCRFEGMTEADTERVSDAIYAKPAAPKRPVGNP